jgi:hypothetical protein
MIGIARRLRIPQANCAKGYFLTSCNTVAHSFTQPFVSGKYQYCILVSAIIIFADFPVLHAVATTL